MTAICICFNTVITTLLVVLTQTGVNTVGGKNVVICDIHTFHSFYDLTCSSLDQPCITVIWCSLTVDYNLYKYRLLLNTNTQSSSEMKCFKWLTQYCIPSRPIPPSDIVNIQHCYFGQDGPESKYCYKWGSLSPQGRLAAMIQIAF